MSYRMDLHDFLETENCANCTSPALAEKLSEIIGCPADEIVSVRLVVAEDLMLCVELDEDDGFGDGGNRFDCVRLAMDKDFWAFQELKGNSTYGTLMHTVRRQIRNAAVIASVKIGNWHSKIKSGFATKRREWLERKERWKSMNEHKSIGERLPALLDSINRLDGGVELHSVPLYSYISQELDKPLRRITMYAADGDIVLMAEIDNEDDDVVVIPLASSILKGAAA